MHRGEQPGHLPQRAQLEDRVVQRGLPLEQDAAQLEDHAEPERQRHRHRPHLAGDRRVGVDDDLGLAAAQPGDLDRLLEALGRADPRDVLRRGDQREPDPLALEAPDQGHPAALEQLPLGSGESAGGGEGTGKAGESGRGVEAMSIYPSQEGDTRDLRRRTYRSATGLRCVDSVRQ